MGCSECNTQYKSKHGDLGIRSNIINKIRDYLKRRRKNLKRLKIFVICSSPMDFKIQFDHVWIQTLQSQMFYDMRGNK